MLSVTYNTAEYHYKGEAMTKTIYNEGGKSGEIYPEEITHSDWARRFTIACGNKWHEVDGESCNGWAKYFKNAQGPSNPTYLNPADILDKVDKWPDKGKLFFAQLMYGKGSKK